MSEPELVLDSASVKVFFQEGEPSAAEFWVNFNAMRDFHITCAEFIRRRSAPALHVISKQDNWYRGHDMADVVRFINERTVASGLRTILLGNSMGGFGVLRHSAALHCDMVIASGPQVIVDHDRSIGKDDRYRPEWAALETDEWHAWHDAREGVRRDRPVRVLYDPHAPEDAWHAKFLRGIPNIEFWRAPFAGHETLLELARAKLWVPAMEALIAGDYPAFSALLPAFRRHRHERFPYHLVMGARHYERRRLDHSIRHFRRMVEIRPAFVEGHQFLAVALRDAGLQDEAIAAMDYATRNLDGDDRFWWTFQGLANLNAEIGRIDAAREALLRGKAMFPDRGELEAEHAKLRLHTARTSADLSAAAKHVARAISLDANEPDHPRLASRIYAQRARLIAARGRGATVVAALERIAASETADIDVRHQLSRIYEAEGRIDDAVAVLDPIRPADLGDPERHWILHRYANLHAVRGELPEARALLEQLAAAAPTGHILADLADVQERQGDREGALVTAEQAVAAFGRGADGAWLHHRLAGIRLRGGDWAGAEAGVSAALARRPDDAGLVAALARVKLDRPRPSPAAAARLARKALALSPDDAAAAALLKEADLRRARLLTERGRPRAAARLIEGVLAVDPEDVSLHLELGLAREAGGDRDGAIAALQDFAARAGRRPGGWWIYHRLVQLHAAAGDLAAAEAALAAAARLHPRVADTHAELGKFRIEKPRANPAAAARSLDRALAIVPDHPGYRALRDQAERMRADRLTAAGRHHAAALLHARRVAAVPADIARHVDLATALDAAGRPREAAAAMYAAAALTRPYPGGWWPYHHAASMLARAGDLAGTERALIEAMTLFPADPVTLGELGKFTFEKPDPDHAAAARLLRRAIALSPAEGRYRTLLHECRRSARRRPVGVQVRAALQAALGRLHRGRAVLPPH